MNWDKIYKQEFFNAPNCYKECDSYCCNNFFGKYYNFLDKDAVIIPMLDDEYKVYKKRGGIKNIKEKKYKIEVTSNRFLTFYLLSCKEKGLCNPHSNRPFICRIYPYIPKVDYNSNIIGYNYASFMDIFYSNSIKHNCPLVAKDENKIKEQIENNLPKFDPKMIFVLTLIDEVIKHIKKYLPENIDKLDIENQKKFIAKFEMLMLSGKAFKEVDIGKIYKDISKIYGEFL